MTLFTLHYALSPKGIWKLRICQNDDLDCHFLKPELFQMKICGCFSCLQFRFQFLFGYELKTVFCKSKNLPKNQLQCKQAAERMRIKLRGLIEHSPSKPNPNISADPDYEKNWKIFVHFKYQIYTEGLPP